VHHIFHVTHPTSKPWLRASTHSAFGLHTGSHKRAAHAPARAVSSRTASGANIDNGSALARRARRNSEYVLVFALIVGCSCTVVARTPAPRSHARAQRSAHTAAPPCSQRFGSIPNGARAAAPRTRAARRVRCPVALEFRRSAAPASAPSCGQR